MVLILIETWKYAIRGALAVAFSAAVVGGSIYVILDEKEARQKASPKTPPPVASEPTSEPSEPKPELSEQSREILQNTPVSAERIPSKEQDDPGAAGRSATLDRFVSESIAHAAPRGLKIIRELPRSQEELAEAFWNAEPCAVVPPNRPLEQTSWAPDQSEDSTESSSAPSEPLGLRRSVLAIGLSLSAEDQERLSETKRKRILENLHSHYISIQVGIQRDAERGASYLHHLPFIATARFDGPPVTGRAGAAIVASAGEFRRLGIWVADGASAADDNLRTLVLMHRQMVRDPESDDPAKLRPNYELVFIHARPSDPIVADSHRGRSAADSFAVQADQKFPLAPSNERDGLMQPEPTELAAVVDADERCASETLTLHAFITSGGRSRLHHLPSATPSHPAACGIRANVQLIDFDPATADPARSIVGKVSITDRADYPVAELDRYVSTQGWSGDAWDHVPEILNAAVDAKLELARAPVTSDADVTFTNATTDAPSSDQR